MTETTSDKGKQTAYERWEMASFGQESDAERAEKERRMRKDDEIIKAKAAKLYEDAQKTGYSKGYTKGMQDGFAVGLQNAKEQVDAEAAVLHHIAGQFQTALESADEKIADDVLGLALDIAQAMIKQSLKLDEKAILPIVMDVIHYLPTVEKPARMIVNPEDANVIRKHLGDELVNDGWLIQEDPQVESGGCMIETGANQIDASNAVRWKRISEAFSKQVEWKRA